MNIKVTKWIHFNCIYLQSGSWFLLIKMPFSILAVPEQTDVTEELSTSYPDTFTTKHEKKTWSEVADSPVEATGVLFSWRFYQHDSLGKNKK